MRASVGAALSALGGLACSCGSADPRAREDARLAPIDPAPQNEHLGYRMIALEVDDMQNATDYLRTKGVDIVWGPRVRETYSRAEICDPNGYHIELRQWFT